MVEMLVALGILTMAVIPISMSFAGEKREFGIYYHRALAMEAVDGEMEILRAGEWKSFPEGQQSYTMQNPTNHPRR